MSETPRVAIVDFGMGNLHNVRRACEHVGLAADITSDPRTVVAAPAVILPGIGAMPGAMRTLAATGLADAIRETTARGTPLLGVCLGMQLLMSHGTEFEPHPGLGIFPGQVVRFPNAAADGSRLKIPHIGWTAIQPTGARGDERWVGTPLEFTRAGTRMYFVHSYHVVPEDETLVLATADYGGRSFVAALGRGNIFATQFHPERGGPDGLTIYRQFAARVLALTSPQSRRESLDVR